MNRFPTTRQQRAVLRKIDDAEASMLPLDWAEGVHPDSFQQIAASEPEPDPEDREDDRGMQMLAGLMLTLCLACVLAAVWFAPRLTN